MADTQTITTSQGNFTENWSGLGLDRDVGSEDEAETFGLSTKTRSYISLETVSKPRRLGPGDRHWYDMPKTCTFMRNDVVEWIQQQTNLC